MDRNTETVEAPETTFFSFDKPLTTQAERTLQLLMERYSDAEGKPLVKFETDSLVTLRIPRVILPTYLQRAAS